MPTFAQFLLEFVELGILSPSTPWHRRFYLLYSFAIIIKSALLNCNVTARLGRVDYTLEKAKAVVESDLLAAEVLSRVVGQIIDLLVHLLELFVSGQLCECCLRLVTCEVANGIPLLLLVVSIRLERFAINSMQRSHLLLRLVTGESNASRILSICAFALSH